MAEETTSYALPDLRFIERDGQRILQQKYGVIFDDDSQGQEFRDVPFVDVGKVLNEPAPADGHGIESTGD